MENFLVEPTAKYIDRIENSAHYLNCPKHMLNYELDCLYRQHISEKPEKMLANICEFLKSYDFDKPMKLAISFYTWRKNISMGEFDKLNVNPYVNNIPKHIEKKHKLICDWIDAHTKYYPYGGYIKEVKSYPFKYK